MAKKGKKGSALKFFKFLIIFGSVVFILAFLGNRLILFLTHAELFRIRAVNLDPSLKNVNINLDSLEKLKGKNIFKVNLFAIERDFRNRYPGIDQLRLMRHFPDKIDVVVDRREPFAVINARGRNILVDRKGLVVPANLQPSSKLPVITGVNLNQEAVVGKSLRRPEITMALNVIRAVQTNEDLQPYPLVSIDVSNMSNISFLLSNQMKIIIDDDKIYPKIRKLGILLAHSNIDLKDYRYIDLRFNEPVLGKNEENIK